MSRNNSVAALITGLGGGSTQIGPGWANNVESNVNTTYMTTGITVNYAAVAAIVNSQGIPLISDASNVVSGMSWIGRAGALNSGVLGTIVTVADTNWLAIAHGETSQGNVKVKAGKVLGSDSSWTGGGKSYQFTVTFTSAMPDTNYSLCGNVSSGVGLGYLFWNVSGSPGNNSTTTMYFNTATGGGFADYPKFSIAVFR